MLNINTRQLAALGVSGLLAAPEGPRAVPISLDFSQSTEYDIDLQGYMSQTFISMVQAIFIDNSDNGSPLQVNIGNGGQVIQIAPNRQGYFMLLCPNPVVLIRFISQGGVPVQVQLLNFPVANHDWPSIAGA
jgi:hypothetical protein